MKSRYILRLRVMGDVFLLGLPILIWFVLFKTAYWIDGDAKFYCMDMYNFFGAILIPICLVLYFPIIKLMIKDIKKYGRSLVKKE